MGTPKTADFHQADVSLSTKVGGLQARAAIEEPREGVKRRREGSPHSSHQGGGKHLHPWGQLCSEPQLMPVGKPGHLLRAWS